MVPCSWRILYGETCFRLPSGCSNNEVVDIPGLPGGWNDGLADGVERDTRKASGGEQFTNFGLFIEAKTVLEDGAASGAPRCERANHKTSIWSQNAIASATST